MNRTRAASISPAKPRGMKITITTTAAPYTMMYEVLSGRNTSGRNHSSTAPRIAPLIDDDPPTISITRNTTDWSNEYESGLMNFVRVREQAAGQPGIRSGEHERDDLVAGASIPEARAAISFSRIASSARPTRVVLIRQAMYAHASTATSTM